jgi:hypothetical protein
MDIALVRRATGGPGYRAVPLRRDHFVAALPLDHPHATSPADDPLDLGELATEPGVWIPRDISPDTTTRSSCRDYGCSVQARNRPVMPAFRALGGVACSSRWCRA